MATSSQIEWEKLIASDLFKEILLQSDRSFSANRQQPVVQVDTEKCLVRCAALFAKELVAKSASASKIRHCSSGPIQLADVQFVLKHQWPVYDSSAYNKRTND